MIKFLTRLVGADRAWPALMMIIFIVVVIGGGLTARSCSRQDSAAQTQQATKGADAYAGAAKDAVATVIASGERENDVDAVVASATKEIDNAKDPVAARVAVVRAVCGLRAYADRPECAVR